MIELTNLEGPWEKTIEVKDILGQKVLASDKSDIGRVYGLRFGLKSLEFEGIIANKGLFASDYYVGRDYIDTLNEQGAILNIVPIQAFVGKETFDSEGEKIGTVKSIKILDVSNDIFSMIVSRGPGKEDMNVYEHMIGKIGDTITLKKQVS